MRARHVPTLAAAAAWGLLALPALAAPPGGAPVGSTPTDAWRLCTAAADGPERLACFDAWANNQPWQSPAASAQAEPTSAAAPSGAALPAPAPIVATSATPLTRDAMPADPVVRGCNDAKYSAMTRFWELTEGTDCGVFTVRGYRPMSISVVAGNSVNRLPSSPAADHQSTTSTDYRSTETRLNISVRTKLATGLLAHTPERKDSLWVGYTQQSYWQVFSPDLSRPFRTTDHEPEVIYVYPLSLALPGGWNWAYAGAGLVHQSNGQSLPLSRSWNRWYLMTGLEKGNDFAVTSRIWKRLNEGADSDDNPDIVNLLGRAELTGTWNPNRVHTLSATVRSSLGSTPRGSLRLEWLRTLGEGIGGGRSNLRLHTQLFSGYGDSLIDYNRKRTVLSVGFSLLDF
ncbi:MAG: phospholipase A [Comamonas sp.]